jgi:hypothetical protein
MDAMDETLARLAEDHVVVLALDDLADLVNEPAADPFRPHRSPSHAGIDDLAATLTAAARLPDDLTVRVALATPAAPNVSVADAEAAMHRAADEATWDAWREAMAVRNMGKRQLPLGLGITGVAVLCAYGSAYLASQASSPWLVALFAAIAGIAITVAWVVSWMVVESTILDWRPAGRTAAAYDLLARAKLEVVEDAVTTAPSSAAPT